LDKKGVAHFPYAPQTIKEPSPAVVTRRMGGGPCGGDKPASEGTGQAKACPTRPTIEVKQPSTRNAGHLSYGAAAPRTVQVVTPGRGIDHDGRTLARGFQDGNQLGRRF